MTVLGVLVSVCTCAFICLYMWCLLLSEDLLSCIATPTHLSREDLKHLRAGFVVLFCTELQEEAGHAVTVVRVLGHGKLPLELFINKAHQKLLQHKVYLINSSMTSIKHIICQLRKTYQQNNQIVR